MQSEGHPGAPHANANIGNADANPTGTAAKDNAETQRTDEPFSSHLLHDL